MEKCVKEGELMVIQKELEAFDKRIDKCEAVVTRNYKDIMQEISDLRKVYDAIHELSTNVAIVATESRITKESVMDLSADIKELKHLPKETENIKETVRVIQSDVDNFKKAPAEDLRHYRRAIVVGVIMIIIGAFLAGTYC